MIKGIVIWPGPGPLEYQSAFRYQSGSEPSGEWVPLVDREDQCRFLGQELGRPVIEIRRLEDGGTFYITEITADIDN